MEEQKLLQLLQNHPEKGLEQIMKQYMGICYAKNASSFLAAIHVRCIALALSHS